MNCEHPFIPDLCLLRVGPSSNVNLIQRYSNLAQKMILESSLFDRKISALLSKSYEFSKVHALSRYDLLLLLTLQEHDLALIHARAPEYGVGNILWLLVDKSCQRNKFGTFLLDQCIKFYRELGAHKIRVTSPIISNKEFYLKSGFEEEGVLKNHWHKISFYNYGLFLDSYKSF